MIIRLFGASLRPLSAIPNHAATSPPTTPPPPPLAGPTNVTVTSLGNAKWARTFYYTASWVDAAYVEQYNGTVSAYIDTCALGAALRDAPPPLLACRTRAETSALALSPLPCVRSSIEGCGMYTSMCSVGADNYHQVQQPVQGFR